MPLKVDLLNIIVVKPTSFISVSKILWKKDFSYDTFHSQHNVLIVNALDLSHIIILVIKIMGYGHIAAYS